MMKVVKNQTSVNHCPKNYGETTWEIGVLDSVLLIVKTGNNYAEKFKILAMVAQQNLCANQKLKM